MSGFETILLLDDERAVRVLATRALDVEGYRVLPAGTATEALEIADAYPGHIQLVIADVELPDMHGVDVVRQLRRTRPAMCCLFTSGQTPDHDRRMSPEDVLAKPFSPHGLARAVRDVLDRSAHP